MGPSLPLAFQPEPCAQSSQWGRFLDRVAQHGPESEERNGSMRRCPTCGNLFPRKFFPALSHPPRSSLGQPYGLLSEHPPQLYAGSYLSSSLHSAPPHTPCGLCGTFHTSTDYQAAVHWQTMNPFALPRPYWCPPVANSFLSMDSHLKTFPISSAREYCSFHTPDSRRYQYPCPNSPPGYIFTSA